VDQLGDFLAELGPDLIEAGGGVLDRVMEQGGAERLGIEAHAGADLGDADRVGDELVSRVAHLVGVALAGELEGALDGGAVDRRDRNRGPARTCAVFTRRGVELLDHGKEIGEEFLARYRGVSLSRYSRASRSSSLYAWNAAERSSFVPSEDTTPTVPSPAPGSPRTRSSSAKTLKQRAAVSGASGCAPPPARASRRAPPPQSPASRSDLKTAATVSREGAWYSRTASEKPRCGSVP